MFHPTRNLSLILMFFFLTCVIVSQAQLSQVGDRESLNADDVVDWQQLIPEGGSYFTLLPNPFSAVSQNGISVNVSHPGMDSFFATNHTSIWGGNFTSGDFLIYTQIYRGTITISFMPQISAVGTQFNSGNYETFTASIEAFDNNGSSLGSFTRTGVTANTYDNTAPFLGVSSPTANIASIRLDLTNSHSFAINQLSIRPTPGTAFTVGELLLYRVRRTLSNLLHLHFVP